MEYAPGGDLCSLVKAQRERRFPEGRARPFCRQLVSALTYMHGRGIIHRSVGGSGQCHTDQLVDQAGNAHVSLRHHCIVHKLLSTNATPFAGRSYNPGTIRRSVIPDPGTIRRCHTILVRFAGQSYDLGTW